MPTFNVFLSLLTGPTVSEICNECSKYISTHTKWSSVKFNFALSYNKRVQHIYMKTGFQTSDNSNVGRN